MAIIKKSTRPAQSASRPSTSRPSTASTNGLWDDAPTELTRRAAFVNIYGDDGTGKTTLAFTAPGPIAYIHCAEKIEGVIQRFAHKIGPNMDGTNGVLDFAISVGRDQSPQEISAIAMPVWEKVRAAWYDAFNWARTIIMDTDTEAYELIRYAYFGDFSPQAGRVDRNWGPVNADWKSMLKAFKAQDRTNVILISHTTDEYKESANPNTGKSGSQKTGRRIRKGQDSVAFYADVRLMTESNTESVLERMSGGGPKRKIGGGGVTKPEWMYRSTIMKPWWNGAMLGETFHDELSTFPMVMGLLTETNPEEWGGSNE